MGRHSVFLFRIISVAVRMGYGITWINVGVLVSNSAALIRRAAGDRARTGRSGVRSWL